jgi:hypothetical protein
LISSYQWDNQKIVRQVYEDMAIHDIRVWFDIWGSMQGNTNETMATGPFFLLNFPLLLKY